VPLNFSNKKSKLNNELENDRADLIKIEIYIRKLQALKLERQLGIQPSIFTKDLVCENQVEVVNVPAFELDASIDLFDDYYFSIFVFAFAYASTI